jgi:hexosaminidase
LGIGGFLPLEKVYAFEPVPPDISADKKHHILGGQANLWTEYISTTRHAEYMLLPRLAALAEVVWSNKERCDLINFKRRLEAHYDRLTAMDINFRVPPPEGLGGSTVVFRDTLVALSPAVKNGQIRFTLDGLDPTPKSPLYTQPILLNRTCLIKAATFLPGGRSSFPAAKLFSRVDREANGLAYQYYEGQWDSLPDVTGLTPVKSGRCYDLNPAVIPAAEKNYALLFTTILEMPRDGEFTFYLESDDGSALRIDDQVVIKNDSRYSLIGKSGTLYLSAGQHTMTVLYQQKWGDAVLKLSYSGPGFGPHPVPAELYLYPKQ